MKNNTNMPVVHYFARFVYLLGFLGFTFMAVSCMLGFLPSASNAENIPIEHENIAAGQENAAMGQIEANNTIPGEEFCELHEFYCPDEDVPSQEERYRVVSAYNPVTEQTDGDPCISASGVDICIGMAQGKHYVATNELPFGTKVRINNIIYEVVDRTSNKYQYLYDIAFPADQYAEAIQWGVRTLNVQPL